MIWYHLVFPAMYIVLIIQMKKFLVISAFRPVHPKEFFIEDHFAGIILSTLMINVLMILFTVMSYSISEFSGLGINDQYYAS